MKRVVLIADAGPARPLAPTSWRLVQMARLYRRLGVPVDMVLTGAGLDEADILAAGRIADRVTVARGPVREGERLLERIARPAGLLAVHLLGRGAAGDLGAAAAGLGGVVVRDLACEDAGADGVPGADLVLAGSDRALGALHPGGRGIRLPWLPPPLTPVAALRPRPVLAPEQGLIGWAGPGGAALADGWSALLAALAGLRGDWPGGVMLAGPWAGDVQVPEAMRGVRRMRAPPNPVAAFGALDLAVLPGPMAAGADFLVAAALRRGVPVLALDATAALFGDRWRLARPRDTGEMAAIIADEGVAGPAPARVSPETALAAAVAEIDRDGVAMEDHFIKCFNIVTAEN